jgi:hypothetical protein
MMNIASSMPNQFCPNFWQPHFMNSQPNPVALQQFQQPQPSWQPSQQFYPQSRASQSSNRNQFEKYCHHHPTVRQDQNQVQDFRTRKLYHLFGTIMPITGGSAMEFETKRQRNNYFGSVNTIINDGPAA